MVYCTRVRSPPVADKIKGGYYNNTNNLEIAIQSNARMLCSYVDALAIDLTAPTTIGSAESGIMGGKWKGYIKYVAEEYFLEKKRLLSY